MIHFCRVMREEDPYFSVRESGEEISRQDVHFPDLCRRLPVMEDTLAFHEHINRKISVSGKGDDYHQLRLQMQIPSLVSDICGYKAANPSSSQSLESDLNTFMDWYGLKETQEDYSTVRNAVKVIWTSNESCPCRDQKPLFQAEKEAERALAYLDSLSLSVFACELLTSSLRFIFYALTQRIEGLLGELRATLGVDPDRSSHAAEEEFKEDMDLLSENVNKVTAELRAVAGRKAGNGAMDVEGLRAIVLLLDTVAGLVERIEKHAIRVDEVQSVLIHFAQESHGPLSSDISSPSSSSSSSSSSLDSRSPCDLMERLVLALSRGRKHQLRSADEVSIAMDLIKSLAWHDGYVGIVQASSISAKASSWKHHWHSYDGRELGLPSAKAFSVRMPAAHGDVKRAPPTETVFAMEAEITRQEELRISFIIPEDDFFFE
jgi:hypothetical protein